MADELERKAIGQLISESTGARPEGDGSAPLTLPLLMQNVIPGVDLLASEKDKLLHDVQHRPDEMKVEDYENSVPIEEFGIALLRGMGWKEGMAVGRRSYNDKCAFRTLVLLWKC